MECERKSMSTRPADLIKNIGEENHKKYEEVISIIKNISDQNLRQVLLLSMVDRTNNPGEQVQTYMAGIVNIFIRGEYSNDPNLLQDVLCEIINTVAESEENQET